MNADERRLFGGGSEGLIKIVRPALLRALRGFKFKCKFKFKFKFKCKCKCKDTLARFIGKDTGARRAYRLNSALREPMTWSTKPVL